MAIASAVEKEGSEEVVRIAVSEVTAAACLSLIHPWSAPLKSHFALDISPSFPCLPSTLPFCLSLSLNSRDERTIEASL